MRQLSVKYGVAVATLRRNFDDYHPPQKTVDVTPYPVALVFDGTFFKRSGGWLVFRAEGKNIYWQQIVNETVAGTSGALLLPQK